MQQTQQRNSSTQVLLRGLLIVFLLASAPHASASQTSGTIDSSYKYAFSNVGGYVNFAPTSGGLTINEFKLTGYAWVANDGWLNFSPTNGGVTNTSSGSLSGFAWDQTAGWVNFSGVSIDSSGKFHGQATGGAVNGASYILTFDCTNCDVRTDWRPAAARVYPGAISPVYIPPQTQTPSQPASVPPTTSPATQPAVEPPLGEKPPVQTTTKTTSTATSGAPLLGNAPYYPGGMTSTTTQYATSTYPIKQTPPVVQTPAPLLASTTMPSLLETFLLSPFLLVVVAGVLGGIVMLGGWWYLVRYNKIGT